MRTRQTCGPSGSKAAIFSILLIRAPVASLLELTQMFQTEISFLLGVDISIFPPWSPGKGTAQGGFHPHGCCSREKVKLASCPRPCSPRPGLALAWSWPPSCPQSPWALPWRPDILSPSNCVLWASGWERERGQMGRRSPEWLAGGIRAYF